MRRGLLNNCFHKWIIVGILLASSIGFVEAAEQREVRFPPLWRMHAVANSDGWEWEGTGSGGWPVLLDDARRHLGAQGWTLRQLTDVARRPKTVLSVWARHDKRLLLLTREAGIGTWTIMAGRSDAKKLGKPPLATGTKMNNEL